ncbi:MAG: ZIP family metal transporter [Candidatus Omnitrophica bacterium]|nr:ZIP family metal transporter [Candidatus Omnitrophota bacterium]
MVLMWILLSTTLVSLLSLVGIIGIGLREEVFDRMLILLVGFAAGALIGGAFLHLLPEAMEECGCNSVFLYALVGFLVFFMMERYLYWRHCHEGKCDVHTFTYLNLLGDGVHNFTDGIIIAASFVADIKLGIVTTLAVILHEIPQELGDFGILVYGGFSRKKALLFNFICGVSAMLGAIFGYVISGLTENISSFLISFTAGGFIYIAASDLVPELHKQKDIRRANIALLMFILGILFMALARLLG